jgi:aspartyl-tRNA synthetase
MMIEPLRGRKRTHRCGDLRAEHAGERVRLMGWAHRVRDHGGVLFLDLRDRYGITQVVFNPPDTSEKLIEQSKTLRNEFVIQVTGKVANRPAGMANAKHATGEI